MTPYKSLLEETLEAWAYTRQGVIDEVSNIPEKDFGFRPTPKNRSVAELAHHIIESGLMMSGELTRPDGDFQRQDYPDFLTAFPTKSIIVGNWRCTSGCSAACRR